ncbi:MAG: adenylyl-sulfate kinase [Firmicutes bacterium]|nr:adenylyl-sulfate kinase [Bacillota bacterium]
MVSIRKDINNKNESIDSGQNGGQKINKVDNRRARQDRGNSPDHNDNITWHKGKVGFVERCQNLRQTGQVLWFTGLSGSGKSTIAVELEKKLLEQRKAVYRLDGDNIRHGLNSDLGFSAKDRRENIRRIAEVAALFKDAGIITLVSFISPYRDSREFARECIGSDFFKEIYVKADLETCIERDPKGLYKKALAGEIADFTGISAPYQEPEEPSLVLDTGKLSLEESLKMVLGVLNYDQ